MCPFQGFKILHNENIHHQLPKRSPFLKFNCPFLSRKRIHYHQSPFPGKAEQQKPAPVFRARRNKALIGNGGKKNAGNRSSIFSPRKSARKSVYHRSQRKRARTVCSPGNYLLPVSAKTRHAICIMKMENERVNSPFPPLVIRDKY